MHAENKKTLHQINCYIFFFFFYPKRVDNFLIFFTNTYYEYSFEASQRGDSTEDPQHKISLKAPYSSEIDSLLSNNGLIN